MANNMQFTQFQLTIKPTVLRFGQGRPHIMTVGPLHGDERAVVFLQGELIRQARENPPKGTLTVIALPNFLGTVLQTRNDPIQQRDPNRMFNLDLSEAKSYMELVTATIKEVAKTGDLVIDVHNYGTNRILPQIVVLDAGGKKKVARKALRCGLELKTLVIKVDEVDLEDSANMVGTLSCSLLRESIPSFLLEVSPERYLSDEDISKIASSILGLFEKKELFRKNDRGVIKYSTLEKVGQRKCPLGFFAFNPASNLQPGDVVNKGEYVGTLTDLSTFETSEVKAPAEGQIILLAPRRVCPPGVSIIQIGKTVNRQL